MICRLAKRKTLTGSYDNVLSDMIILIDLGSFNGLSAHNLG